MSGVTIENGVANQYLTPTVWWQWLLTGKLEITEKKAYLVTWFSKTDLGDVKIVADHAELEEGKLNIFDESNTAAQLDLEGYRWSKPGEFNGRNALIAFGLVTLLATYLFARKV